MQEIGTRFFLRHRVLLPDSNGFVSSVFAEALEEKRRMGLRFFRCVLVAIVLLACQPPGEISILDHREHHLESFDSFQGMRNVCRENNALAGFEIKRTSTDDDLRFAV